MDINTAMRAAEHAEQYGYSSYMMRAAIALAAEVKRLRGRTLGDKINDGAQKLPAQPGGQFALMNAATYAKTLPVQPGADSRTLGGAS